MSDRPMDRHDPRRNDALALVRRMVRAGNFTKSDVTSWNMELGADVVAGIVKEFAPKKAAKAEKKKAEPKDEPAAPETTE